MTKPIYFYTHPKYGSSFLRGEQVVNKLRFKGYNCKIISKFTPNIKNSIIFMIKGTIYNHHRFDSSNYLVWDVVDFITCDKQLEWFLKTVNNVDLLLYHNNKFPEYLRKDHRVFKNYEIIPHHWDERLRNFEGVKNQFKVGYVGDFNSSIHLDCLEDKESTCNTIDFRDEDFLKKFEKYSCHFDIKDPNSHKFKTCSSIKLSTASALGCGIILNKSWSNLHLLPEDSIFFTDGNSEEEIREKMKELESVFYSAWWLHHADSLREIKEETDLNNIIKLYEKIIREH